jgi:hypothetical protein
LKGDPRFRNFRVEVIKPGWHRIVGSVTSSNDIADLKQMLRTNGITQCTFLVEVER